MLSRTDSTAPTHDSNTLYSAASTPPTRRERAWLDQALRHQTPHYEECLVTPSLAEMMLACNRANRPTTKRHVEHYARLIKEGLFQNSPQPLVFDRTGRLLDGQHRLLAIRATGLPVRLRVFFGEAPEVFEVLDTGRKRTTGDFVGALGVNNATKTAATIRYDILIAKGYRGKVDIANQEIMDALNSPDYEYIQDSIRLRIRWDKAMGKGAAVNSGASVGLLHILRKVPLELVEPFVSSVADGLGLPSASDPRYRLRQRLVHGGRVVPMVTAAIVIKAWNAYATGRSIGALGWRDDEPFPAVMVPK